MIETVSQVAGFRNIVRGGKNAKDNETSVPTNNATEILLGKASEQNESNDNITLNVKPASPRRVNPLDSVGMRNWLLPGPAIISKHKAARIAPMN